MKEFQAPDSSFCARKLLRVPAISGDINMYCSLNTPASFSAIIMVRLDAFDRVMGDKGKIDGDFGSTPSKILSKHRKDIQVKDGGLKIPSLFVQGGRNGRDEVFQVFGKSTIEYLRSRGADFIPLQVHCTTDDFSDIQPIADQFGVTEPPLLGKNMLIEGDSLNGVLGPDDHTFIFTLEDVAAMTWSRGINHYQMQFAGLQRQIDDLKESRKEGKISDLDYEFAKQELERVIQETMNTYGAYPQCHRLVNMLAAAGMETVHLQKNYSSQHCLADLMQQAQLFAKDVLQPQGEAIDLVSRYERLLAFNPESSMPAKYLTISPEDDALMTAMRSALAKAIARDPSAIQLAISELRPEQISKLQMDIIAPPPVPVIPEARQ